MRLLVSKKHVKLIAAIFLLTFLIGSTITVMANSIKIISIGYEDWEPYQSMNDKKEFSGLDVELLKAIAKEANFDIKAKYLPWKRHLDNVKRGKTDLASGASKTAEREEYAYFSIAYRTESVVMYVRKGESEKYKFSSLKDIIGTSFKIGTILGYYYGEDYAELLKNPEFKKHVQELANNEKNPMKLNMGRIDGMIIDPFAGAVLIRKYDLLGKFEVHPMKIYSDDIYIMFSKKSTSPETVKVFNEAIEKIKQNGTYDKIINKYLN